MKLSLGVLLPVSILHPRVGSHLGRHRDQVPADEGRGRWRRSGTPARRARSRRPRSAVGQARTRTPTKIIEIPHLLSILATGTWDGQVVGINELQAQYEQKYGPGDYIPNLFIQYWSMRVMAYLGSLLPILALWGCFLWWRGTAASPRRVPAGSAPGPSWRRS